QHRPRQVFPRRLRQRHQHRPIHHQRHRGAQQRRRCRRPEHRNRQHQNRSRPITTPPSVASFLKSQISNPFIPIPECRLNFQISDLKSLHWTTGARPVAAIPPRPPTSHVGRVTVFRHPTIP